MTHALKLGLVGPLPPPAGGMATQTKQLQELMGQEGIAVTLVQTNRPYRPQVIARWVGIRALFRLIPYLFAVWKLARSVDVIHLMANSGWSWQLFSAPVVWAGWLLKTPVVVNYRGGGASQYFSHSIHRVRPTLNKASEIVVPSGYLQKAFADYGFEAKVIPNIINFERFKPRTEDGNSGDRCHLIVTRNLERIYGIDTAIRAFALAKLVEPRLQLSVAGTGPQRAELEALAQSLNVQDSVSFVGRLDARQIVDFYHSADVMLNPATVDNMPNSVLEALACGVPVATTDVGGIPFIVQHQKTELMFAAGDEQQLANHILTLVNDEDLRQTLIQQGLDSVKAYAWPLVKKQWMQLYRELQVA